jgi:hypothetical protein
VRHSTSVHERKLTAGPSRISPTAPARSNRLPVLLAVATALLSPALGFGGDQGWSLSEAQRPLSWLEEHALYCEFPDPLSAADAKPVRFEGIGSVDGKAVYSSSWSDPGGGLPNGSLVILEGDPAAHTATPVWCDWHENLTLGPAQVVRSSAGTFIDITYCERYCWQEFLLRSHGKWTYVHSRDPLRDEIDGRLRSLGYERPFSTNTFVDIDIGMLMTELEVKPLTGGSAATAVIRLVLEGNRLAVGHVTIRQPPREVSERARAPLPPSPILLHTGADGFALR